MTGCVVSEMCSHNTRTHRPIQTNTNDHHNTSFSYTGGGGRTGEVKHYGYFAAVFDSVLVEIFDSNSMLLSRYFLTKIHSKKLKTL